jgi:hypothetical protein
MKSLTLFSILFLATNFTWGASFIECGKDLNNDFNFKSHELTLSSDDDAFDGKVGGTWVMRLQGGDWIESGNAYASTSKEDGATIIEVQYYEGTNEILGGSKSIKYKVIDATSDYPTLEKYKTAGFAGAGLVDTFECYANQN